MILEVSWDALHTLSFGALTILWSRLLARVQSGPKSLWDKMENFDFCFYLKNLI